MCYPVVCMEELSARLAADLDGSFGDLVREHQDLVFGVALRVRTMQLPRLISEGSEAGYRSKAMVSAAAIVPSAF